MHYTLKYCTKVREFSNDYVYTTEKQSVMKINQSIKGKFIKTEFSVCLYSLDIS